MVDNDGTTVFMTCSDEIDVKYADIIGYLRNGNLNLVNLPSPFVDDEWIYDCSVIVMEYSVTNCEYYMTSMDGCQIKEKLKLKLK